MSETIKDIVREMRRRALDFKGGNLPSEAVIAAGEDMEMFADRVEAAAHNNPTCINCVAVEKWKAKQAAAKAKKEEDALVDASVRTNDLLIKQIEAKDAEIARLNQKVYEYEKLFAMSPIGEIYQVGICDQDGDVMNGIGILFTNEAEQAKMPRVGHGDKFYVVPRRIENENE